MSRNANSRFAMAPSLNIQRSTFNMSNSVKTTFNVGDVIPFHLQEVLPGDTFSINTSKVVRLQTPLTPVMDNIYLDTYYFFVPNRLVWKHWKEFMGENTESAWLPETEYEMPQITAPASTGWVVNTLADYFGLPVGVPNISVSALPFRAYAKIMDDWFRSENLTDPLLIPDDETTQTGSNGDDYITDVANGGMPFKAAKYKDYFTACLPSPQKGPDVPLPVAQGVPLTSFVPVVTGSSFNDFDYYPKADNGQAYKMSYGNTLDGTSLVGSYYNPLGGSNSVYGFGPYSSVNSGGTALMNANQTTGSSVTAPVAGDFTISGDQKISKVGSSIPLNLVANMSDYSFDLSVGTINELRTAFQIQKFYEKDARGGSRYIELIKQHFGVTSPDARLQRSEYLGGNRVPLTINQVIQTSQTGTTPQGTVTGQSLTTDSHYDFKRSFTEHGYVIGVMVARYDHTYQQGIDRLWSRKDKFDFYWPVFANLGEMAVKNKEIFAQGSEVINEETGKAYDDEVFGYQEAWADYRYKPSFVTGEMRSAATASFDKWHLGDDYESMPYLSDDWIRENLSNVDRVLAVQSSVSNQLFADIYVQNKATRPLPMYSIPGLMDHH